MNVIAKMSLRPMGSRAVPRINASYRMDIILYLSSRERDDVYSEDVTNIKI